MTINSAQAQLLELAAAMRGEDWADDLAGALIAARNAQADPDGEWDFYPAYREAFRLLLAEDGRPKEIRDAIQRTPAQQLGDPKAAAAKALAEFRQRAASSPTRSGRSGAE